MVAQDERVNKATSSYTDDIFINENMSWILRKRVPFVVWAYMQGPKAFKERHMHVRIVCLRGVQ